MHEFKLQFGEPSSPDEQTARGALCWLTDKDSTIRASLASLGHLGPSLGRVGDVADPNVDFVRIAVAVYAADRSVPRDGGGSNWNRRPIKITVPVRCLSQWEASTSELESVVNLLTGDDWTFEFVEDSAPTEMAVDESPPPPARVVLLSGGADSAAGALVSRSELGDGERQALVSHFNGGVLGPLQRSRADSIADLVQGEDQQHFQFNIGRRSKRLDGKGFEDEYSSRSRSLLFLAVGLAVASVHRVPLWIPENGFASLNPPLGMERLGSLSTRTTHPAFLADLSSLLNSAGAHGEITNPFSGNTKGEMFQRVAELIDTSEAAAFLSATNSCSHTGQRAFGESSSTPCGVCFGCVVRRAAFVAAAVPDETQYIDATGNTKLQAWLDRNSIEEAVRRFVARGVKSRDVIALSLPSSYSASDALDLCQRGSQELGGLFA
jgi:hypothetical protein